MSALSYHVQHMPDPAFWQALADHPKPHGQYPNIVVRATKNFAQLPELLAQFPAEFVATGVRNILSGVDTSTTCHEEDISDLFG